MTQQAAKTIAGTTPETGEAWLGVQTRESFRQRVWMAWERAMARFMELSSDRTIDAGICKMMVKRHKGAAIVCADGTRIERGDRIGELHLNNRMVLDLTRELGADRAALRTTRLARASLKELWEALDAGPELSDVKALVGVTLLHRGLVYGIGFEQRRLPSKLFETATSIYLKLLLRFLHPDGLNRSERSKEKLTPVLLVCSRRRLREWCGTKSKRIFNHSSECSPAIP